MNIEDLTVVCDTCKGGDGAYYCYACRQGKVLSEEGRKFMETIAEWLWADRDGDMCVRTDTPNAHDRY